MRLSQKALSGIEKLFLLWVPMNPYNAWMAELEVVSFSANYNDVQTV